MRLREEAMVLKREEAMEKLGKVNLFSLTLPAARTFVAESGRTVESGGV